MRSYPLKRWPAAAGAVVVVLLLSGAAMRPSPAVAAGALAVALPANVAKGGFSYGYSNDNPDVKQASDKALDHCVSTKDAKTDATLRSLCKVVETYSDKCVAVAMDPQNGTPGVGWSIAADLHTAESQALTKCEATAGPGRAAACKVDHSSCDGSAK